MGVRYSATDSAQLIQAMGNNLQIANQVTDRLSSGCDHLVASLESGELQGAAYTAGKGLFTEIIIPAIKRLLMIFRESLLPIKVLIPRWLDMANWTWIY